MEAYKILFESATEEIEQKKSRFIASVTPVETEEEALAFIDKKKKENRDASHNCYAYVIGENNQLKRCSDDGEPSQTAGRPMLDVLVGEELHNVCAVVTRYFGGTLLGTGGLVRAYSGAVSNVLKKSRILLKQPGIELLVTTEYTNVGKIQYLAAQMGIHELESEYADKVYLKYLAAAGQSESFINKITEATSAAAKTEQIKTLYYGILDKQLHIFPELEPINK